MASPETTTRTNHGQMTPESTPGLDADRLAADKQRQKTQAAPTSHDLATPDATPEPGELRILADKARQQQAEHADPKEAPATQSKPPFDAESAAQSQQGSQSQSVGETQAKRKRSGSDHSKQDSDSDHPNSGPIVSRIRKEVKAARKGHKVPKTHVDAPDQEANAVASQSQSGEYQSGDNTDQQTSETMDTDEPQTQNEAGVSPTTATKSWEPGLTRKGEPILGYRTIGVDGKGNPRGYQFVVQIGTKEEPEYALQSGTEIGRRAVDGYLGMDKSKIKRLGEADKNYSRKDAKDYRGIKFVASKPIQTKLAGSGFRFPASVCIASFVNPEREDLIWRSTLRNVLGKTDADADIEEYYDQNELTRPWEVAPTTHRYQEEDEKVKTKSRSGKNQTRKDSPTEDSPNEDTEGEKNQSKEELQAKVVDLESKMDRLLKLMEQQNSAKN